MNPSVTRKTTLPGTQGENLPKTPGTPRCLTPRDNNLLSPGIDSSSSISCSSNSVTLERIAKKRYSKISEMFLNQKKILK